MLSEHAGVGYSNGILGRYRAIQEIRDNPSFSDSAKGKAYQQIHDGIPLKTVYADLRASLTLQVLQEV